MYTNDSQAISAVLKGDKSGYEALVEKHKKMVYGIAWSHLGDSDLSEDAAQETFIKAYTYLGTLREPDKFAGWLARIARNVCNSLRRGAKRDKAFKERWAVLESAETEPRADERESLSEPLWESFADLPAIHREALTAFYIEGKSVAEAAAALGIAESALRTRLHRARTALRAQLEQKLENSLADLQPRQGFTRSVLVLLPLSPKGVIGAGGAFAVVGKLFASLSFALWMAAASALPIWGLYSLLSRVDESSLADVPENEMARSMVRRGYRKAVFGMFVGFAAAWLLIQHAGQMSAMKIIAIVYGCLTLLSVIGAIPQLSRRVSRPGVIGGVLTWLIMFAAVAAIAFFDAPIVTFAVAVLVMSIVSCFTVPRMPQALERIGCNPFLRGAMGLADTPEAMEPLSRRLTRLELRTFARLLAETGIARDYRFRGDALSLSLFGMQPSPISVFGIVPSRSTVAIEPNGACSATISSADLEVVRRITRSAVHAEELQTNACRAVRYALGRFAEGQPQEALDFLSAKLDQPVLPQSRHSARNHRVKMFTWVWLGVMAVVAFSVQSAIVMIIASVVGFLGAGLALAITLWVNKRETPV